MVSIHREDTRVTLGSLREEIKPLMGFDSTSPKRLEKSEKAYCV